MNILDYLIKEYIKKITEEDIYNYAKKEGIELLDEEVKTIYIYIKNYWKIVLKKDSTFIFEELKEKLRKEPYEKLVELYEKYKTQFNK